MSALTPDRRSFIKGVGLTAAGAALASPVLAACGKTSKSTTTSKSSAATGKPVRGGKATIAIQDNPVNMDPADGQLYASLQVYQNIYSELLEVGSDFSFKPNLASEWQQEDAHTWKFSLVDNAVFHNGEPFTANDIAFTIERMRTHGLSAFVEFFKSIEVVDPHTARIHLSRPYGPMEATLASLIDIVNEKAVKAADPKQHPIGTGPYKLKQWVKGSHVTLDRWDKYFKTDQPYLDEVTMQSVSDDSVRLAGLQTGQFDWVQTVPQQQIPALVKSNRIAHTPAGPYFPYLLEVNTTAPPFNDVKVRQAVNWAIDRSEIVKLAFFGAAVEAKEAVSKPNPFYSGADFYEGGPDLDKARSLMSQAKPSTTDATILVEQEDQSYTLIAQVLQSQLKKIGLNMHIETASSAEYFGRMAKQQYGLATTYFSASLDPALTYYLMGYSKSGFNFSGLHSARLDAELAKFTFEADKETRMKVYPEMVRAFQEESPFIFVANRQQQYFSRPQLQGVEVLPSLEIRLEDMWKSK